MTLAGNPVRKLRRLLPLCAAAGLSACVTIPDLTGDPPIDMSSPAARQVAAALTTPGPYPSFADIPLNPPGQARQPPPPNAQAIADGLRAMPAPTDATPAAEAYAASQRALLAGAATPTAADTAATEAFAAAARARATPPSTR